MKKQLKEIRRVLRSQADPVKAQGLRKFFKTGKGQYAEGDVFLGITLPAQRLVARQFASLLLEDISVLLKSSIHEERMTALLILVGQFKAADNPAGAGPLRGSRQKEIFEFYLAHAACINNWDLVDVSAHHIVGAYLHGQSQATQSVVLKRLAHSKLLWERRIAMVSTWHSIQKGRPEPALTVAKMLLADEQDLMHKATGWMLREVGKRVSLPALEDFLQTHHKTMPRTMLRYAIEHFPKGKRKAYLLR